MFLTRHQQLVTGLTRIAAVAVAMLVLTVLVVTRSQAAFSDTTSNAVNTWTTGSVTLTDDDGGAAMFTASVVPNAPVVECIAVTYDGSLLPADVRLYALSSGALAPMLDVTVEVGAGGGFGTCAGFVPSSVVHNGTLDTFGTAWASGAPSFTAAATPTTQIFRFTVTVQDVPAAQGLQATSEFIWEAQG